jgi:5-methyltetrahydropteroyltriglutamate--homocysteine methyltransferase
VGERPYRAEHVGSFPRPQKLLDARRDHAEGKLPLAELRGIEDETVRDVVAMQERVGIGAVTDGEFRKSGWRDFIYDKCDGFTTELMPSPFQFRLYDGTVRQAGGAPGIAGKLRRKRSIAADDFSMLKPMTSRPIKANMPTPSSFHAYAGDKGIAKSAYADRAAMFADVARLYHEEIADLSARGCTYLQLDEVPLAVMCDPKNRDAIRRRGEEPEKLVDDYIDALNQAVTGRPAGMAVTVHFCRGNAGHGMADGGYEPIADRIFNRMDVDGFFLEYDTPRAGDFRPLRFLPKGKKVVLGLMTTKQPEVESIDSLKRRIDEAAQFAPLDQLCISPQCGFSSNVGAGRLTIGQVEAKLARVVEVAHQVWG